MAPHVGAATPIDNRPIVPDSPAVKRRKTESGYNNSTGNSTNDYNSDVDDGDALFEGFIPDTPASKWETQPTQIIDRGALNSSPIEVNSIVLVPASSPFKGRDNEAVMSLQDEVSKPGKATPDTVPQTLALSMAPAGTVYRAPHGNVKRPNIPKLAIINISDDDDDDDGPAFQGGSSDDEGISKANIKPSTFSPRSANDSFGSPGDDRSKSASTNTKFTSLVASMTYKPFEKGRVSSGLVYENRTRDVDVTTSSIANIGKSKPSAHSISSGYGSTVRKPQIQTRPERARPVEDISIKDVPDQRMRDKVIRLRNIFPNVTILLARNVLMTTKGNFEDAAAVLADGPDNISEDEVQEIEPPKKPEPQMKRGLNAPIASIRDKYSTIQDLPAQRPVPVTTPPKPKKRLVRGRRNPSSPAIPSISSPLKPPRTPVVLSDNDSYDSGIASASAEDLELEGRLLKWLNACKVEELVELTSITKEIAGTFLAARPFRSLDAARRVAAPATKTGKKSTRGPIGDKIVDNAIDMFSGYEAVDDLCAKCNEIAKPLVAEMAKWGVDVFGAAKDGAGLGIVSLDEDDKESLRDSGIGSPSSGTASLNGDGDEDITRVVSTRKSRNINFLKQPNMMARNFELKDYQIVGLNWLALMYRQKLSGILADDMGLGKTCQVISFLTHLVETGNRGPHIVITPGSVMENWLREFRNFSPHLVVEPYFGSQKERGEIGDRILYNREKIHVVVSTYELVVKKEDNKFMRRLRPDVAVFDEGHLLKNATSQRYQSISKIPASFRLLLTGTPLQNNLQELATLLGFILPHVFKEKEEELANIFKHKATTTDTDHSALLSNQRIARAKSMLTPFVLRRKKAQVLKHLPAKSCRVQYCTLHPDQREIYDGHVDRAVARARQRIEGIKAAKNENENNPLMQLRKAAIHPLLFRRHFTNAKIETMADVLRKKEPVNFPANHKREHLIAEMQSGSDFWLHSWCVLYPSISRFDIPDLSWMNSGKVTALVELVKLYKENGDRVLIFSQFSLVLDILEAVLSSSIIYFTRIDGSTKMDERQTLIDNFRDDESITAFLLTTKAGGVGLNLAFANKVIIFDGSFNPQDDRQAENRAHRVGQKRPVEVVRLVTKGTVEDAIFALGRSKLELDGRVAGDEETELEGDANEEAQEMVGENAVNKMLLEGVGTKTESAAESPAAHEKDCPNNLKSKKEEGNEGNAEKEDRKKPKSKSISKETFPQSTMRKQSSILSLLTRKESQKAADKKVVEVDEDGEEIL